MEYSCDLLSSAISLGELFIEMNQMSTKAVEYLIYITPSWDILEIMPTRDLLIYHSLVGMDISSLLKLVMSICSDSLNGFDCGKERLLYL